jgi:thiamine biosynthesis lipoprotein
VRTLLTAACVLLLGACTREPAVTLLAGETMGSAWTVKIAGPLPQSEDALRAGVQAQFDAVNAALSTYQADSALSRFNDAPHADWQVLDPELFAVLHYALQLAALSGGAYDVTVGPLVDLWGFGPAPRRESPPDDAQIARVRALVGWRLVELDTAGSRARRPVGVRVDLSSLGKGRGVDRVAQWLDASGVEDYLIDLSGKLRAHGVNAAGEPWRVAVEKPEGDDPSGNPNVTDAVMALRNESVATAGDYRRFFESDGAHF